MNEQVAQMNAEPDAVETRLAELTDLFRRRLVDDRDKRRIIDDLTDRLRTAEAGAYQQFLHPLVTGLALVVDRLDAYAGPDPDFAASIRDELLDVLERHAVVTVETAGPLDLTRHEVTEVRGAALPPESMEVVEVVRRGFRHLEWTFRPARVVAAAADGRAR